jgi:hypothetical protein
VADGPKEVTTSSAILRLAPGDGLVVRHPGALLYVPAGDTRLATAFSASTFGAELRAMASAVVAGGFDVAPFVCLSWQAEDTDSGITRDVRVMAFGEIAVQGRQRR